jgi:23S rRNA (cytidine1920-2'-O)/16S rRNA (cytidine1409-2'-O)-methyltransferase
VKSFHARAERPKAKPAERAAVVRHGGARADALLVQQGHAASRTAAQRMIEAGRVSWSGGVVTKPSLELPSNAELTVAADETDRYVSRGGLKLAGALAHSKLAVAGRLCLDVGQSTGGFTDCLLQAGAARVVGVDVGHDQLSPKLRADPRVECIEGINARALQKSVVAERRFDLIVADLSFISLTLVLPQLPALLAPGGNMLLLVKPQFEVGPEHVGKGGIVRDAGLYAGVEAKLRQAAAAAGLRVIDWFASPITGGDGNREFFIWTQHEQS